MAEISGDAAPQQVTGLPERLAERGREVEGLVATGRLAEAEELACDLRWVAACVRQGECAVVEAVLAVVGTPRCVRLGRLLGQIAHLLVPTDPAEAVVDVLLSRVEHDPDWGPQARVLAASRSGVRLVNRWPLPDLPDPALRRVLAGYSAEVRAIAIAPHGRWLVTGHDDGSVRVWDATTGGMRVLGTVPPVEHSSLSDPNRVTALVVASDTSWLVTGHGSGAVRVWDAATGAVRAVLTGHTERVEAVTVAPDGSWLVTGGNDGFVRFWDAETGVLRAETEGWARCIAVAPDGSWLAVGDNEGRIQILDAAGTQRTAARVHVDDVVAVAVSADGTRLFSAGSYDGVRIWDTDDFDLDEDDLADRYDDVAVDYQQEADPFEAQFGSDGSWLALTETEGQVKIWNVDKDSETGLVAGLQRSDGLGYGLAVAPDGSWLAAASGNGVWIWDLPAQWDPADSDEDDEEDADPDWVGGVAFAPDGSWLATWEDDTINIRDAATGNVRAVHTVASTHAHGTPAVSPDGSWLAIPNRGQVTILDVATGTQRVIHTDHKRAVAAIANSSDGSWIVTASKDGTAQIWDVATGAETAKLTDHQLGNVNVVAVAPDGSWVVAGGHGGWLRIWDVATQSVRAELIGHTDQMMDVTVGPDGSWLATASMDSTVRVWDVATGTQRAELTGHTGWATGVAASPDGSWLATIGNDHTVRIWDLTTHTTIALMRYHQSADAVAWTPDSRGSVLGGEAGLYRFDLQRG